MIGDHLLKGMKENRGIKDIKDVKGINVETYGFTLSTSAITEIMIQLAKEEELAIDLDDMTSRPARRILGKNCYVSNRASGSHTRQWNIKIYHLAQRSGSYGLAVPEIFSIRRGLNLNALNVPNVLNALTPILQTSLPQPTILAQPGA